MAFIGWCIQQNCNCRNGINGEIKWKSGNLWIKGLFSAVLNKFTAVQSPPKWDGKSLIYRKKFNLYENLLMSRTKGK